jgi:hypothetical protein
MIDPKLLEEDLRDDESDDFRDDVEEWEEDPAFDHLRDEERNFIAQEREKENDY